MLCDQSFVSFDTANIRTLFESSSETLNFNNRLTIANSRLDPLDLNRDGTNSNSRGINSVIGGLPFLVGLVSSAIRLPSSVTPAVAGQPRRAGFPLSTARCE